MTLYAHPPLSSSMVASRKSTWQLTDFTVYSRLSSRHANTPPSRDWDRYDDALRQSFLEPRPGGVSEVGLVADRFHSVLATFLTLCGHTPIPSLGPL